jgi:hypothetical protein
MVLCYNNRTQSKVIGGNIMSEKENFIFIASWASTIESFDEMGQSDIAGELAKQIIYYGTKGEITTDNPMIKGIIDGMCKTLIDQSKKKYSACKANGSKGGRPAQYPVEEMVKLRDAGLTDDEIADNLGCGVQTVTRKLKIFDETI